MHSKVVSTYYVWARNMRGFSCVASGLDGVANMFRNSQSSDRARLPTLPPSTWPEQS